MRIALCNMTLQPMPFAEQCSYARAVGYEGIELAPFTLSDAPHRLSEERIAVVRRAAADAGIGIVGLHGLLVQPAGLSITSADATVRERTLDVIARLVDLCAQLGAGYLVHGSPGQRQTPPGESPAVALARATDCWAKAGERARAAGVVYCVEALSRRQTDVVNTLAQAVDIVDAIGNPALRTMLDTSAAGQTESVPPAALIDRWLPTGHIAHVQINDRNRRGPGEGTDLFAPVFAALKRHRYAGVVAVEPFILEPHGQAAAARAIGYVRGILEALD